jgi:hypothetical protein
MSNITFSESICLSSEDIDTDRPAEKTTNSRFVQHGRLFRYEADFRIFNDHFVEVRTGGLFRHPRSYELDCTFLDPHAKRVLRIDWWSGGTFLLLLTGTMAAVARGVAAYFDTRTCGFAGADVWRRRGSAAGMPASFQRQRRVLHPPRAGAITEIPQP